MLCILIISVTLKEIKTQRVTSVELECDLVNLAGSKLLVLIQWNIWNSHLYKSIAIAVLRIFTVFFTSMQWIFIIIIIITNLSILLNDSIPVIENLIMFVTVTVCTEPSVSKTDSHLAIFYLFIEIEQFHAIEISKIILLFGWTTSGRSTTKKSK